jgi:serine/threonine-protein kinase
MARVFLAEDLRHRRQVALKLLNPELGAIIGADRFLQEIEVAARLTHPHILPLFDSGEADGLLWYTMPYIQGETLADRIAREGALPVEEAVRLSCQIAEALDYAHRQNVIHRDIKPANIMLHEGAALVADFGIALAISRADQTRLTSTGMTLGTPMYMSPEQASGDGRIDRRSDVYSLGVVTYEMLTGEPPFVGGSLRAQVARIMVERPIPPRNLRTTVPEPVEAAVLRALAKTPADRFGTGAEFRAALLLDSTLRAPRKRAWRAGLIVAGLCLTIAVVALWSGRPEYRAAIRAEREDRQLTTSGDAWCAALSPDGKRAVYFGDSLRALMLLDLGTGESRELARGTSGKYNSSMPPQWAPGGDRILVHGASGTSYGYYLVDAATGAQELVAANNAFLTFGPGPGSFVATYEGAMYVGSSPTTFQVLGGSLVGDGVLIDLRKAYSFIKQSRTSPSGKWIALIANRPSGEVALALVRSDGSGHRVLLPQLGDLQSPTDDWNRPLQWSADGAELFFPRPQGLGWSIWRLAIDPGTGAPDGEARPLAERLPGFLGFTVAADGTLLYSGGFPQVHLERLRPGRDAWETDLQLTTGTAASTGPALSPDGQRIAYVRSGQDGGSDLFEIGIDGGQERRLTSTGAQKGQPAWSPDGQRIAYLERDSGFVAKILELGTGVTHRVGREPASPSENAPAWTPDGRQLLFQIPSNRNYEVVDLQSGRERRLVANDSVGWLFSPVFGPDGNEAMVFWHRPPRLDLWRVRLSDTLQARIPNTGGGTLHPLGWRQDQLADGEEVDWQQGLTRALVRFDPVTGKVAGRRAVRAQCLAGNIAIFPRDQRAVCAVVMVQSDVWVSRAGR